MSADDTGDDTGGDGGGVPVGGTFFATQEHGVAAVRDPGGDVWHRVTATSDAETDDMNGTNDSTTTEEQLAEQLAAAVKAKMNDTDGGGECTCGGHGGGSNAGGGDDDPLRAEARQILENQSNATAERLDGMPTDVMRQHAVNALEQAGYADLAREHEHALKAQDAAEKRQRERDRRERQERINRLRPDGDGQSASHAARGGGEANAGLDKWEALVDKARGGD